MDTRILPGADGLREAWWELWHRDPAATPFQSPAWLLPWRRHFTEGESIVLTIWQGQRPMGLLPLFRLEGRLLVWGSGTSDWLGGVFDPTLDPEELALAVAGLADPLDLFQLSAFSPLLTMPVPAGWRERKGHSASCMVASLPAALTKKLRENLRYYGRRAAEGGAGEPQLLSSACVRQLAELHRQRWNARQEPGIFADPRMLAWQVEAAAALENQGMVSFFGLDVAGELAGALQVLRGKGQAYYYIGGFAPRFAEMAVGNLLLAHAISEAEKAGFIAFDFLRGGEAYKRRWGAVETPTFARFLSPPAGIGP